jgi:putative transcriptional regulator
MSKLSSLQRDSGSISTSLAPGLLVASPNMKDARFKRAVILLAEASDEGALGFVINKSTHFTFSDISGDIGLKVARSIEQDAVYYGGPVSEERGWVLFREESGVSDPDGEPAVIEVGQTLRVSPTIEVLRQFLLRPDTGEFRLLLGYAGWGPEQLEEEIIEGSWIPLDLDIDLVFRTPENEVWDAALGRLGLTAGAFVMSSGGSA